MSNLKMGREIGRKEKAQRGLRRHKEQTTINQSTSKIHLLPESGTKPALGRELGDGGAPVRFEEKKERSREGMSGEGLVWS